MVNLFSTDVTSLSLFYPRPIKKKKNMFYLEISILLIFLKPLSSQKLAIRSEEEIKKQRRWWHLKNQKILFKKNLLLLFQALIHKYII